jgi:hypothetical protein
VTNKHRQDGNLPYGCRKCYELAKSQVTSPNSTKCVNKCFLFVSICKFCFLISLFRNTPGFTTSVHFLYPLFSLLNLMIRAPNRKEM